MRLFLGQEHDFRGNLEMKNPSTRTIAFISSKGGVGKTHVAVNMAVQFAREGRRVLLIDGDLGSANANFRIGVKPKKTLLDYFNGKADILSCVTITDYGFHLIAGYPGEFTLANASNDNIVMLIEAFEYLVNKSNYTDIIFDLGAGISNRVLDFAIVTDEIIVIATPTEVIHAYSALKACWNRFCSAQNSEFFQQRAVLSNTPYYMRDKYRNGHCSTRINFIVNEVDNLKHGKKVYLAITKVARDFFYTNDGYWKLPMRYLGGIPSAYDFLKQSERGSLPAIVMNPHHQYSHAIREIVNAFQERIYHAPNELKISFRDKVRSVMKGWRLA